MRKAFDWLNENIYDEMERNSDYWHQYANELRKSSKILWESWGEGDLLDGGRTSIMLMGLSFELLLKSIHIQDGKQPKGTHDLNELLQGLGALTKKERQILTVLSGYITWEGRYPVPKPKNKIENMRKQSNPFLNTMSVHDQLDGKSNQTLSRDDLSYDVLFAIWAKINKKYIDKI